MTNEQAVSIMAMLTIAYPREEISSSTTAMYVQFLKDIPFEAGKAAALNLIAESKFFPRVSELRQAAIDIVPGNRIPSSAEAWAEVKKEISRCCQFDIPKFSHLAIEKAVRTIGLNSIRCSENEDVTRAHFMKIYDTYRQRAQSEILAIPESRELEKIASRMGVLALVEPDKAG